MNEKMNWSFVYAYKLEFLVKNDSPVIIGSGVEVETLADSLE